MSISSKSASPSLSHVPTALSTERCDWIEISLLPDSFPHETSWELHRVVGDSDADGTQIGSLIRSYPVELRIDGSFYNAVIVRGSATKTSATGMLCDCGLGMSQCECQGKVCLIERGDIDFIDKVSNCEAGEGIAAIIYNNVPEDMTPSLGDTLAGIPVVFISQVDGQYLLSDKIGATVEVEVHETFFANTLNTQRVCLKDGEYEFIIHDSWGNGHYTVTSLSNGALIAEGGELSVGVRVLGKRVAMRRTSFGRER